jgi:hypothetical protein
MMRDIRFGSEVTLAVVFALVTVGCIAGGLNIPAAFSAFAVLSISVAAIANRMGR